MQRYQIPVLLDYAAISTTLFVKHVARYTQFVQVSRIQGVFCGWMAGNGLIPGQFS